MFKLLLIPTSLILLTGCAQETMRILEGATHARGDAHVEGPLTDTQLDIRLCKVPPEYSVDQALQFCTQN